MFTLMGATCSRRSRPRQQDGSTAAWDVGNGEGAAEIKMSQVRQEILDEIIRRIVEAAQPETIILCGSAVRGEMGPSSDVDLLVSWSLLSSPC